MNVPERYLASIGQVADAYDAYILDLWGVIHDGTQLYPRVKECLQELRDRNKKIIFLSNAPRRAITVQEALERMGITQNLYDTIITSGETAYQYLAQTTELGKQYFYIGLEKDRKILEGLDYAEVKDPAQAQFLLLAHTYIDNQPMAELLPLMQACLKNNIPALCINPDMEVVRMGGQRVYCAGEMAAEYEKLGGKVLYFGKPHPAVYEACFKTFSGIDKSRIVAVGDNLATDILGANKNRFASVLVTGGVLSGITKPLDEAQYRAKCEELFLAAKAIPSYIIRSFSWWV
jgi:HAD superfamily hydrolase (TIGR01459 family)